MRSNFSLSLLSSIKRESRVRLKTLTKCLLAQLQEAFLRGRRRADAFSSSTIMPYLVFLRFLGVLSSCLRMNALHTCVDISRQQLISPRGCRSIPKQRVIFRTCVLSLLSTTRCSMTYVFPDAACDFHSVFAALTLLGDMSVESEHCRANEMSYVLVMRAFGREGR